jgi:hypothetical protein
MVSSIVKRREGSSPNASVVRGEMLQGPTTAQCVPIEARVQGTHLFQNGQFPKVASCLSRRLRGPGASRPHGRDTSVGAYGHDLGRPRAEPATSEFRPVRLDIRWAAVAQLD